MNYASRMFEANLTPSFNVTRASHAVMTARDLDATQAFYCDVLGLIASARDPDVLYLRATLNLRPAPEFEAWLIETGIADRQGHVRALAPDHPSARRMLAATGEMRHAG